jgi:hypothetical protein
VPFASALPVFEFMSAVQASALSGRNVVLGR